MKKEIIVISDLWGIRKGDWYKHFEKLLSDRYRLCFYDACKLGKIDLEPFEQSFLHQQFIDFGIDQAAKSLINLETNSKFVIGCSIGGIIAWRAIQMGMAIDALITISATRLRFETTELPIRNLNYFGRDDINKPDSTWMKTVGKNSSVIISGNHELYHSKKLLKEVLLDNELLHMYSI